MSSQENQTGKTLQGEILLLPPTCGPLCIMRRGVFPPPLTAVGWGCSHCFQRGPRGVCVPALALREMEIQRPAKARLVSGVSPAFTSLSRALGLHWGDPGNKSALLSGQVLSPVCRLLLCGRPVNGSLESCVIQGNTLPSQLAAGRPLLHLLPPWDVQRKDAGKDT